MLNPSELARDGKLVAAAIDGARCDAGVWSGALAAAGPDQKAALAIVAGRLGLPVIPALVAQLAADGLAGRAAAWALGRIGGEREILAAIEAGGLDVRENGYQALAGLAAHGKASAALAAALAARIEAELAKAKAGGSGLGEHACRALAVLGAPGAAELVQKVREGDRFSDKFELDRLRRALADGGRDRDTARVLTGPWTDVFADHLWSPPAEKPAPEPPPAKAPAAAPAAGRPSAKTPAKTPPPPPPADEMEEGEPAMEGEDGAAPAAKPIDWKAFATSPEAQGLGPQVAQMAPQLGGMLEQLAMRAVQAPLTDLSGQEFMALILQVLPQALPPQHAQMALSPQAINVYGALAKYLDRTGQATNGAELVAAVKDIRKLMTEQMRRSGMLGGPDYSDPDDKKPAKK